MSGLDVTVGDVEAHVEATSKIYTLGIKQFEAAIIAFGVDSALEYFGTPEEIQHLWDDMKKIEAAYLAKKKGGVL